MNREDGWYIAKNVYDPLVRWAFFFEENKIKFLVRDDLFLDEENRLVNLDKFSLRYNKRVNIELALIENSDNIQNLENITALDGNDLIDNSIHSIQTCFYITYENLKLPFINIVDYNPDFYKENFLDYQFVNVIKQKPLSFYSFVDFL